MHHLNFSSSSIVYTHKYSINLGFLIIFASRTVGGCAKLQASHLEMREGEIHTLLLDFLDIDQQQKGWRCSWDQPGFLEGRRVQWLQTVCLHDLSLLCSYPHNLVFYPSISTTYPSVPILTHVH